MTRILVVEDENIIAEDIQDILKNLGYVTAGVAAYGEEAVQKAEELAPDIVLMDIVLKGEMDGIEAAQRIRSQFNIPVVYLTAYSDDRTLQRARVTEPFGYILKPFEEREIHVTVEMALYKHTMERQLKESRDWFSTTLRSIGDAVITTDNKGNVTFMNPLAETLTGWKYEEAKGNPLESVFNIANEETGEKAENPVEKVLREGVVVGLANHTVLIARDGTEIPIMDSGAPIKDSGRGEIIGVVMVFQDMSERRMIEKALFESFNKAETERSQKDAIIASLGDALNITSTDFKVMYQNRISRELFGDHVGEHCYMAYQDRENICEGCPVELSFNDKAIHTRERIRQTDGRFTYFEITSSPLLDQNGNVTAGIELIRDITVRKESEAEKAKLEAQLRHSQKLEAVGQLAGGVAHDFNNILQGIISYGYLLNQNIGKDDPLKSHVEQILACVQRASHLTYSLLAYSRKQILDLKNVDLNEIVMSMEKLLSRLIREDIELQIRTVGNNLNIMADEGQIEQILMNLATNAKDAMPEGGTLSISTDVLEMNHEYVVVHGYGKPGRYALVTVSDTGIGIDEESIEKIFEPFFTTKDVGKGTGLGLAMVYSIVKQHNGYINVYSELQRGTTFKIYLPLITSEGRLSISEEHPLPAGGTETVILADDNEVVRNSTRKILEEYGYSVIEAVDGADAVEKFSENKDIIRLLILDVIMPKKNGKKVYDEIREMNPEAKVLFMSGYTADLIHQKTLIDNKLDLIMKPIDPNNLLSRIRAILDR